MTKPLYTGSELDMELYEAKKTKRLAMEPVSIDWETACVNALTKYILNNEYMTNNYSNILHRVLLNLDTRRKQLETYK